jgi:hypothetical protein
MKEIIEEILNLAVNAPSGNNSQPWRFVVDKNKISLWNIPNKDQFLFNYQQRGSLIANGAILENIQIIASAKGYRTEVILFPKQNKSDLIAEITLEKSDVKYPYDYLYASILKRTTNRKPYKKINLNVEDSKSIQGFCDTVKNLGLEIVLTQNVKDIENLSKSFSVADRLIFENFNIHEAFFAKVSYTRKEEERRGEGLYIRTKEIPFLMRIIFKYIFSNWNILKILQKVHISEKAAKKREELYKNCSAIGIIFAQGDLPKNFVETGKALQLFWLKITSLGLSFQPVSAGLLYIGQRIQEEIPKEFTLEQVTFIKEAYQNILAIFNNPIRIPTFSFRIGYSDPPTASSTKRLPQITWIKE